MVNVRRGQDRHREKAKHDERAGENGGKANANGTAEVDPGGAPNHGEGDEPFDSRIEIGREVAEVLVEEDRIDGHVD
jgi:hypothetical protein